MNPLAQPDLHPNADSLSAFAEKALPEPTRAQIVAHMAGCARCREVVFLAQKAMEAEAGEAAALSFAPEPRRGWFSPGLRQWRIALVPVTALAAVGGILAWVQFRPSPPRVTVAQNTPHETIPMSSSPQPTTPKQPVAPAPASARLATQDSLRKNSESAMLSAQREAIGKPSTRTLPQAGKKAIPEELGSAADEAAMSLPQPQQEGISQPAPFPSAMANTQWQAPQPSGAVRMGTARPAPAPSNSLAVHGSAMISAQGGPQAIAAGAPRQPLLAPGAAPPAQLELMPGDMNEFMAMRLAKHSRLPSGRTTVSSAVTMQSVLAVDSGGTVFLSHDAGSHWETVATQWSGKAIEVRSCEILWPPTPSQTGRKDATQDCAQPPVYRGLTNTVETGLTRNADRPDKSGESAATDLVVTQPKATPLSANRAAPPVSPAALFKLVNDHHKTWISVDGKVWHEQ